MSNVAFFIVLFFELAVGSITMLFVLCFYSKDFPKRKYFAVRLVAVILILLATNAAETFIYYNFTDNRYLYNQIMSLVFLVIELICYSLLYKQSVSAMISIFVLAYITEMIPVFILEFFYAVAGVSWNANYVMMLFYIFENLFFKVLTFLCIWYLIFKNLKLFAVGHMNLRVLVLLVYCGVATICVNDFRETYVGMYTGNIKGLNIFLILFSLVNCLFILYSVYICIKETEIVYRNETLNEMLKQDRIRYEARKENIDALNIKSHDLKHFINMLKKQDTASDSGEICAELEKIVKSYDSDINTGCEALDIILSENSAYCSANNITLKCIVDSQALVNIKDTDIYSLFGNILSNSIEYLITVENYEKRVCLIEVKRKNGMSVIHQENYFSGTLSKKSGEIVTTKKDTVNHGYGLKSIAAITEKYGGTLSVSTKNELFLLNILLPL